MNYTNHVVRNAQKNNNSIQKAQTSAKENLVRIQSPYAESGYGSRLRIQTWDPDDFQNVTGTSLFEVTFVIKFSWISDQFVPRYEPNCGKMPYLATLKNSPKNSWIQIQKQMTSKI